MGKSTISMAIFNCYVSSPEGIWTSGFDRDKHARSWVNGGWFAVLTVFPSTLSHRRFCNILRHTNIMLTCRVSVFCAVVLKLGTPFHPLVHSHYPYSMTICFPVFTGGSLLLHLPGFPYLTSPWRSIGWWIVGINASQWVFSVPLVVMPAINGTINGWVEGKKLQKTTG